jgi:hypothetical protein
MAGGTFESDTDGTFQTAVDGTFVSATGGTFETAIGGTFESDTGGTFAPLLSMIGCKDEIVENESVTSGPRTRSESIDEQEICLTPSSTPPEWYFSTRTRSTSDLNEVTLGICVHVIRDSNGYSYGIDKTSVANSIINTLGTYFLGTKINFRFFGSDYIDSDKYNSYRALTYPAT